MLVKRYRNKKEFGLLWLFWCDHSAISQDAHVLAKKLNFDMGINIGITIAINNFSG